MFKNFSIFQIVLVGTFALIAFVSFVLFVTFEGNNKSVSKLSIWTDMPAAELWNYLEQNAPEEVESLTILPYEGDDFVAKVVSEFSLGKYPDIIITTTENQRRLGARLRSIPSDSLPESQFIESYVPGALAAFKSSEGFTGIPLAVDSLILYSNQRQLNNLGITKPPSFWDEVSELTSLFAKRSGSIVNQVIMPMGTATNTVAGSNIFNSMVNQVGLSVIFNNNDTLQSDLFKKEAVEVLNYYTDFANPNSGVYNWNQSFADSQDTFVAEESVFYLDFSSRAKVLEGKNPNLIIEYSELPQIRDRAKYAEAIYYGAYVPYGSQTTAAAISYINQISGDEGAAELLLNSGYAPALRSRLNPRAEAQLSAVVSRSALYSGSTYGSNNPNSQQAFEDLIDEVLYRGGNYTKALSDYARDLIDIVS